MTSETQIFGGEDSGRSWIAAMGRGARKKCPQCGRGRLFKSYVKTEEECDTCGLAISGHEADDAPPYITIMIVGHIAIPLALASKQLFDPPLWQQFAFWLPVMALATAWLLPVSKGAMIGLQWANRMHGFAIAREPEPAADQEF
ncbi:MAG: DUF983 domain-containing protein [Pseudomonadota bacterium]